MRDGQLGDPPDGIVPKATTCIPEIPVPKSMNLSGRLLSGNLKVYESRRLKKKRALLVNDSTSEESLGFHRGKLSHSSGVREPELDYLDSNVSVRIKPKFMEDINARANGCMEPKNTQAPSNLSKSTSQSCKSATRFYSSAKQDMAKFRLERTEKHIEWPVKYDTIPKNKSKPSGSSWKYREEEDKPKKVLATKALSSSILKSRRPIYRREEEDFEYAKGLTSKRTASFSGVNDAAVSGRSKETGKRLKLRGAEDDHVGNRLKGDAAVRWDRSLRVPGKGGVLRVMSSRDAQLDSLRRKYSLREVENRRKSAPSNYFEDGRVAYRPNSALGGKQVLIRHPSESTTKRLKTPETVEVSSSLDSMSTDSGSTQTERNSKKQTSSTYVRPLPLKSKSHTEVSHKPQKSDKQGDGKIEKQKLPHTDVMLKRDNAERGVHDRLPSRPTMSKYDDQMLQNGRDRPANTGTLKTDGLPAAKNVHLNIKNDDMKNVESAPVRLKKKDQQGAKNIEKQFLREKIRGMLLEAGWTIDERPRRGRVYNDSVYISPSGSGYWSIVKAYDVFEQELGSSKSEDKKLNGARPALSPIPAEVLGILKRNTKKKRMREEMAKQNAGDMEGSKSKLKKKGSARNLKRQHLAKSSKRMDADCSGKSDLHVREGSTSNNNLTAERKKKNPRCGLLVRSLNKGDKECNENWSQYRSKLSVLSWLIDSGIVPENAEVHYMSKKHSQIMLEGWVTREGIHCSCCSKILSVSRFEMHAGSKLRQPYKYIFLETGVSLLQCQLDAWKSQSPSYRRSFYFIEADGADPNDDTCGICGDGGDLICCDTCPSTFHLCCLNMKVLPPGDWHCSNCTCKKCSSADDTSAPLLSCRQCEKKYHLGCVGEDASDDIGNTFCEMNCRKVFEKLQMLLGVKNDLDAGLSWTLIQRIDEDTDDSPHSLAERAEWNSKVAVAMTLMDECFLPIVDQRSRINLIHNVVYNCGSNFNRLNYNGFYTVVLERGDEFISAATIRVHGTRLAEMPFIGTRQVYRRQGMCRRLLNAIESALCSLDVKDLIIPAIPELIDTWSLAFGFKPLEDVHKHDMRSLNMLVFPGADLLQKSLLRHETSRASKVYHPVLEAVESLRGHHQTEVTHGLVSASSPVENGMHALQEGNSIHIGGMLHASASEVESEFTLLEGSLMANQTVLQSHQVAPTDCISQAHLDASFVEPNVDANVIMDRDLHGDDSQISVEGAAESYGKICHSVAHDHDSSLGAAGVSNHEAVLNDNQFEWSTAAGKNIVMEPCSVVPHDAGKDELSLVSASDTLKEEEKEVKVITGLSNSHVCVSGSSDLNSEASDAIRAYSSEDCLKPMVEDAVPCLLETGHSRNVEQFIKADADCSSDPSGCVSNVQELNMYALSTEKYVQPSDDVFASDVSIIADKHM